MDDFTRLQIEIAHQLLRLEKAGERTTIELGPYSAFMLVAVCQLTARRFSADDIQGDVFEFIAESFKPYFEGTAAGDFIATGWRETMEARETKKKRKETGK